jgi:hypothetical protein
MVLNGRSNQEKGNLAGNYQKMLDKEGVEYLRYKDRMFFEMIELKLS